jgi:hypothetical protein
VPFKFKHAPEDVTVNMIVRLPGWLKNEIYDQLEANNETLNTWIIGAIHQQLRHGNARPEAKRLPDAAEVIADYLTGRETLAPCGVLYPCPDLRVRHIGAFGYCDSCHIRLG